MTQKKRLLHESNSTYAAASFLFMWLLRALM
nr:MAG TPA: hypothetical protein [Caudoviricetes sp.]